MPSLVLHGRSCADARAGAVETPRGKAVWAELSLICSPAVLVFN
jgi:hypothetical protein